MNQSLFNAPDGYSEMDGDGGGWGFNLGVLYAVSEEVSLGAAYRSRADVRVKGEITLKDIAPPLQPLFGGSEFSTGTSWLRTGGACRVQEEVQEELIHVGGH